MPYSFGHEELIINDAAILVPKIKLSFIELQIALNNNNKPTILHLTQELGKAMLAIERIRRREDSSVPEIIIDATFSGNLMDWMRCCYLKESYGNLFFSAKSSGGKIDKFNFSNLLSVFKMFSKNPDLDKDFEFLNKLVTLEIDSLVDASDNSSIPTIEVIGPILARLEWALSSIKLLNKKPLMDKIIDEDLFWRVGFNTERITYITNILRGFGLLRDSTARARLEEIQGELANLSSDELYERLATNQRTVINVHTNTLSGGHYAALSQTKYSSLNECHCRDEFTRNTHNARQIAENHLLTLAKNYEHGSLRLAIIGSGGLLQVSIIVVKLSKSYKFSEINLDLIDPINFDYKQAVEFKRIAQQFEKLLAYLGFDVNMLASAKSIIGTKSPSFGNKGKINLEFYNDCYQQPADILFANDVPLDEQQITKLLENARKDAYFIGAINSNAYTDSNGRIQSNITINFNQKAVYNNVRYIFQTRKNGLWSKDLDTIELYNFAKITTSIPMINQSACLS